MRRRTFLSTATIGLLSARASRAGSAGDWPLGVRLSSYGKFQDDAWAHLPSIGVKHAYVQVPEEAEVGALASRLKQHGLDATVVGGHANLAAASAVDELDLQCASAAALGARFLFLSAKHEGTSRDEAIRRLREAGRKAQARGVTIVLETHPDLGTNAAVQLETMRDVDHPNVRVNFDTGNISYYNDCADAVAELRKIAPFVATVELKDHDRKGRSWFFPALGRGKTDFRGVLEVLDAGGFAGPFTVEIEGVEGQEWTREQTLQAVAESVAYLRKLHAFD